MNEDFKQSGKVKHRSAWRLPLLMVAAFMLAVLVVAFAFRVTTIEVVNASEYTDREIIEASGIQQGDNLFFVDRFNSASLIFSELKYMDVISIQRSLPGKIVIQASGAAPAFYIKNTGIHWLIARNGKVLGDVSALDAERYPEVRGIVSPVALPGQNLICDDPTDSARLAYACDMISAIRAEDIADDFEWIDFTTVSNPCAWYQDRLTVYFGEEGDSAMRIAQFLAAVAMLSEDDTGSMYYTEGAVWNYAPD